MSRFLTALAIFLVLSPLAKAESFTQVRFQAEAGFEKCPVGMREGCVSLVSEPRAIVVVFTKGGPTQCGQISLDGGDPNRNHCGHISIATSYRDFSFQFVGEVLFNYFDATPMYYPGKLFVAGRAVSRQAGKNPGLMQYIFERIPAPTDAALRVNGPGIPVEGDPSQEYVPYFVLLSREVLLGR